jgi:hypothetical protein
MTWGGTKIFFREIVTLETWDMPQKVFFGAFWTHWRQVAVAPCQIIFSKIIFLSPPWVAVLKLWNNFFCFPTEKKKFLRRPYFGMNHCHFLTKKCAIFCVQYLQNYKLTPAPSKNCFAIFLLRVRSNKTDSRASKCLPSSQKQCCIFTSLFLWHRVGILGHKSQFDLIFSRHRREKVLVKLTWGLQNDSQGYKNRVVF